MNKRIRILATSDVHGYIYPYNYSDGMSADLGMARLHTMIESLKDENTLIIDNGDNLQGSPLAYHHFIAHAQDVSPVTKAMNAIGYDYINLGNHDFNYGEEALFKHIDNIQAPCITSNVLYKGKPIGPTYVIRQIAGKKIALFAVTSQYVPNWESPDHIKHMKFLDAFETAKKTVELVRKWEKPDYVIGIYHGGLERDLVNGRPAEELTGENEGYQMMKEISGLDILITGHQHRNLAGKLFNTVYTQAPANGTALACIDIYTDTGVIEPHILSADMEPSEMIQELVQDREDECQAWLDQPLGTSKIDLSITDEVQSRLHKSQVVTFLNRVGKDLTGADICASAIYSGATGFGKEITMRNLVSTYPFPNTVVVKKINGRILREYLEKDADFWSISQEHITISPWHNEPKQTYYNYDMLDGIEYTIKVSNPIGQRIISLTRNGEEITDDMEFTLCLNNYRASGGGDFMMLKNAPVVTAIDKSMVEILADWLNENKVIDFEPVNNITIIK